MTSIDWAGLMRTGLCGLQLGPRTFWSLTPAELEIMMGKPSRFAPMKRDALETLLRSYPDTMQGD